MLEPGVNVERIQCMAWAKNLLSCLAECCSFTRKFESLSYRLLSMSVVCCVIDLVIFSNELLSPTTGLIFSFVYFDILEIAQRKLFLNGWPAKSVIALSSQQFRLVGELVVMSILQGGPAPNFLDPAVYSYISKSSLDSDKNENILNRTIAKNVSYFAVIKLS